MNQNNTGRYIKYAVGEIFLVVVGILIALQINNWNTLKKDRILERQYLEKFVREMQGDSTFINGYWSYMYPQKIRGLEIARDYAKYGTKITDTAEFFKMTGIGGVLSRSALFENKSTYRDIISTGNLRLIKNNQLREILTYYYSTLDNTVVYIDNLRTDYATVMNSIMPYDPEDSFKPDQLDIELALEQMRDKDFLQLANNELTFAYSLSARFNNVERILENVMRLIYQELNHQ